MAISTYKVFLMKKADTGEQWSKLIDIKEFPDLGGEPEMLETTTLSDNMQTYIAGIQSLDGLSFTANYTLADFQTLKALEGKKVSYAVWFGGTESDGTVTPDGSNGKFSFDGELSVYMEVTMDKKEKKSLPEPRTYTVEQIAAMLNIGRTTAYQLVKQEEFRIVRIGNAIRVSKKSFDEWLESLEL